MLRILALAGLLIQAGCGPGLFVSPEAQALYDRVAWSVVIVEARDGAGGVARGSGVVIAPGRVATACHVLAGGHALAVLRQWQRYPATVARANPRDDACVLDAPALPAPAAVAGDSQALRAGDPVYGIAAPGRGLVDIAEGRFSARVRHGDQEYLQTTAEIARGASGGGLFNRHGELVGLLAFYLGPQGGTLNYAVPVERIMRTTP